MSAKTRNAYAAYLARQGRPLPAQVDVYRGVWSAKAHPIGEASPRGGADRDGRNTRPGSAPRSEEPSRGEAQ